MREQHALSDNGAKLFPQFVIILNFYILLPVFAGREAGFLLKGRRKVASGAE